MKTIAYQGATGAYSYTTGLKEFGPNNLFIGLKTFKEVFDLVECGQADYAVIPIENSLIGSIYENYDLLNTYDIHIIGEQFTRIEHCLLAISSSESLKMVKKVLSHPKALEQCTNFLQEHPWIEAVVYYDTAAAAAEVASKGDPTWAAIADSRAGELYGLHILKKGIEDDSKNYTRFVILAKKESQSTQLDKCSLVLELEHLPGALTKMLEHITDRTINLTKIQSRPIRGSLFEYQFYIDFEFQGTTQQEVESLLCALGDKVRKLKILGFYKKGIL